MSKYLKTFETEAAYTAAQSGLILPNVSLVTENNTVHYNPYVDPYGGHDYVEIGGVKWATMNIGANSVTDTGLYFAWGETQGYTAAEVGTESGQRAFKWEEYKYGNGTSNPSETGMTKYNSTDRKTVLDAEDDAAVANWGGAWRMPTNAELQALGTATTSAWTADYEGSGVAGVVCTDKTDSSKVLFFPAAGFYNGVWLIKFGEECKFWFSSLASIGSVNANYLSSDSNGIYFKSQSRCFGSTVRPVAD